MKQQVAVITLPFLSATAAATITKYTQKNDFFSLKRYSQSNHRLLQNKKIAVISIPKVRERNLYIQLY